MEDRLVSRLSLVVGLRVTNVDEPSLAAQVVEIVTEPIGVELPVVIKGDGTRYAEASDAVPPNEPSYLSDGYGGYGLGLYPLGEVVHRYKEILALPCSLEERAEDVHSPSRKW